jgi:hypothetical protein
MLLIMDDCASSSSFMRSPLMEELFRHPRHYAITTWRPLTEAELAAIKARRQRADRATFFRAQLWQRVPVKDVLNIVACFYNDAFDAKERSCTVVPPLAERLCIYRTLVDFQARMLGR